MTAVVIMNMGKELGTDEKSETDVSEMNLLYKLLYCNFYLNLHFSNRNPDILHVLVS